MAANLHFSGPDQLVVGLSVVATVAINNSNCGKAQGTCHWNKEYLLEIIGSCWWF